MILRAATQDQRALMTENVSDFRRIALAQIADGRAHYGLIFTTTHRFPRGDPGTLGRVIIALSSLLADKPEEAALLNREVWLRQSISAPPRSFCPWFGSGLC